MVVVGSYVRHEWGIGWCWGGRIGGCVRASAREVYIRVGMHMRVELP